MTTTTEMTSEPRAPDANSRGIARRMPAPRTVLRVVLTVAAAATIAGTIVRSLS